MADITDEQLKAEWDKADIDKSGTLSFKEILRLLGKFNLKLKEKQAKKIFQQVDADGSGELDFEEFRNFLAQLRIRPEVDEIFHIFGHKALKDGKDESDDDDDDIIWSPEDVLEFLHRAQGDTHMTLEDAKRIVSEFVTSKPKEGSKEEFGLRARGFQAYLCCPANSAFVPKHSTVYQDMEQPFAHYFISSSHNTYLLGDQLAGESSVEAYKNAFKKNCRCVELDCWDSTVDGKILPIIYHGHTLTSKITFLEVIETIRDFGFQHSEYPIILSLEVHCSIEGQQEMARIVREVLGKAGMLADQPATTGVLPPPGQLKRKVLLKGKMLPKEAQLDVSQDDDDDDDDEDDEENLNASQAQKEDLSKSKKDKEEAVKKAKAEKKKQPKPKTAKELSDLITFPTKGVHSFAENKGKGKAWEMSSFAESKVEKFIAKQPLEFLDYNTRQLSRIYPKGVRFDSSNYDPVPSWTCGSQIVALNYQTGTEPMWLNQGKFLDNGYSGYVLKPEYQRVKEVTWTPGNPGPVKKNLIVTIISGWQFPKSHGTHKEENQRGNVIDPYVKVGISGVPADNKEFKTKTIKNNGYNPIWRTEYQFPLTTPDLALLKFIVMDEEGTIDRFIGQFVLPALSVHEGFRVVPLKDKDGNIYEKASLLVHLRWEGSSVPSRDAVLAAMEGSLLKRADFFNRYDQRYFLLRDGQLKYYRGNSAQKKPRKTIPVKGAVCKSIDNTTFSVSAGGKTYQLRTTSEQDLSKWKNALSAHGSKWQ